MMFSFADTHAYPGCRVVLREGAEQGVCLAGFSDGSVVPATRQDVADGIRLTVGAYDTRRGTRIGEKTWLLREDGAGGMKVAKRL